VTQYRLRGYEARTPQQIDYERMRTEGPRLRKLVEDAAGDPLKMQDAVRETVRIWDEIGAWPDNWHDVVRAFDDTMYEHGALRLAQFEEVAYRRQNIEAAPE